MNVMTSLKSFRPGVLLSPPPSSPTQGCHQLVVEWQWVGTGAADAPNVAIAGMGREAVAVALRHRGCPSSAAAGADVAVLSPQAGVLL